MRRLWGVANFRRDERAAAVVELTLVMPFLILVTAGLSEFGLMVSQQQVITKSVRDAARYAARVGFATASCPLTTQSGWSQLVTDTQNIALRGSVSPSAPLLISTFNNVSMVSVANTCQPLGTLISPAGIGNDIPVITVTATLPYAGIGFLSFLGLSSFNLTAAHAEMWAGL